MNLREQISEPLANDLDVVATIARTLRLDVWLVGGPVRDALLKREVRDLDFLLEDRLEEMATAVADRLSASLLIHREFLTAAVRLPSGRVIDFTTSRTERYPEPGSLPVVQPAPVTQDLRRRDFTVNAIAWNCISGEILDPLNGRADLVLRRIRTLHGESFLDDPTRIFRAIRLAERLAFELDSETERLLREAVTARAVDTVSAQRIWREVVLALEEELAPRVLSRLMGAGVLLQWLGATSVDSALDERLHRLSELMDQGSDLDVEVLYLATILQACGGSASLPIELASRRAALLRRLIDRGVIRVETWLSLTTDEDRGLYCLQHEPEEIVFTAAQLEDPAAGTDLVDTCHAVRSARLPFTGADLDVPPGPHIGMALRDARVRAWLGDLPPHELLPFAREAALRYLNDQT